MITITMQRNFTVILENWDGKCKRATVQAFDASHAYGVAMTRFPNWTCVEVISQ
jgi:hypothetical protein